MIAELRLGLAFLCALAIHTVATAQSQPPPAAAPLSAYGDLPAVEMVALSPTGRRLAFVTVAGEDRLLAVVNLDDQSLVGRAGIGETKVRDVQWIGEDKVVVTASSTESLPQLGLGKEELFYGQVFDPAAGSVTSMLARNHDLFPALVGPVDVIEDGERGIYVRAHSFASPGGPDLYRIDPTTGRARVAERMDREVDGYVLDPAGRSVARAHYDGRTKVWSLHLRQGDELKEVWRTEAPLDAPTLMGLGLLGESVVIAADRPDLDRPGREPTGYFDVDLATGTWRPLRFDFDPTALIFHPSTHRLIGAMRLDEAEARYAWFDDAAAGLWDGAEAALPGQSPRLVSWSDDLTRAVVFVSGARDSGSYHLIDVGTGEHTAIGSVYPAITSDQVASITPISYPAADGLEIRGYLTLPPGREPTSLPLVVLAHGGPASRDHLEFDWWGQALAAQGYAVLQPNFRGSTGYGRAFLEAGYGEWGRKMQTDLSDGVRWLAAQGTIDPARVCIVGASYGGYAALAGPTLDRGVYRCAVAVAGVSDLRLMVEHEAKSGARRDNEAVRYWNRFMGSEGPSDRSLDTRSPARLAAQADAPIFLLHGKDDTVVPIAQSRIMAEALRRAGKPHELIELNGEDHWLSNASTRRRMLEETVRFLARHNPAD